MTTEREAMDTALALAATPGVPLGPNPRVGCVLLSPSGEVVGEGYHRGAGTPHAEVDALRAAGEAACGATAVVTLEPCDHTGRTGPCTQALLAAGVRRVVHAVADPNPDAAGGATTLRAAGVEVVGGLAEDAARALNRAWLHGLAHGRPFVTWKLAATLDGRSAAADGTSRWVSGPESRLDTHRLRAEADTMLVGTSTILVDDPLLTVRDADGDPLPHQPLRAVMGLRDLPADARVLADVPGAPDTPATLHLRTRDPHEAMSALFEQGRRHVFCEGGPTLAAALWRAGVVDEVVCYTTPMLLGAGRAAVGDLGVTTIADAVRPEVVDVTRVGDDVRWTLRPRRQ
ncbi:bifunctional diaminohydroxyphosphoribosylaminopyrimidine deaminase/5-amino-6-(5-phosphoribosylamino)uracil reductase RibD [uncultured Nocardioides sp.]|uniref:bifunctional diaminohydroxyphosphoribosylaminopyrimidine deaminase/5-amino-6-(5-phosphoribosylamino)uracil reductase RibD n=1 Tax=uncultured Nocardioides sp. TaxID=198441 RepID=UPI00262B6FC5|nr:bifunctional diaminohydroxyphosphoribosylaminopyrimidine deaminase/5-amino-6-(5-phosphoribosylamino)uracil reductase RibD [uncultured Nocardioides sp.]